MNYYKIIKGLYSVIKRFDTLEEAQAFAETLGDGYTAEFYAPYVPITLQERLKIIELWRLHLSNQSRS
mgnify:CR=1 FL=1